MSEINMTSIKDTKKYTFLFGTSYIILSILQFVLSGNGALSGAGLLSQLAGTALTALLMFSYYLFLMTLGEKVNKGVFLLFPNLIFMLVSTFLFRDAETAFFELMDILSASAASMTVCWCALKKELRSFACAMASFIMLAFSVISFFFSLLFLSVIKDVSIGTILFDGINEFINVTVAMSRDLISSVAAQYPGIDTSTLNIGMAQLESELTAAIALLPAMICAVLFFAILLFTYAADRLCICFGITSEKCFGRFEISAITHAVFNIFGLILLFSFFFESRMSVFTCGILSVIIVLLPNYLILGSRRIFNSLSRSLPKYIAVIILVAIMLAGARFFPTLTIFILVMFGTTEYRISKHGNVVR